MGPPGHLYSADGTPRESQHPLTDINADFRSIPQDETCRRLSVGRHAGHPERTKGHTEVEFIQIIEYRTDDIEAVQAIDQEWLDATEGKRTARRQILTRDRNDPDRHLAVVFFDSYESAMENSNLPETDALAGKYGKVTKDAVFHDLDVISNIEA
jgi:hypothetical protein